MEQIMEQTYGTNHFVWRIRMPPDLSIRSNTVILLTERMAWKFAKMICMRTDLSKDQYETKTNKQKVVKMMPNA